MQQIISYVSPNVARLNTYIPHATIANGLVFVSGMAGILPTTGQLISNSSFEAQARQAFSNIEVILRDAGSDMGKVLKTTIFMVTGEDPTFTAINKVYEEFFPENPPARSAPQVMPFPGNILVSIEVIATL